MKRTNTAKWHEKYSRWQIQVQKDNERRTFYSSTPGRNGQREANRKADAWLDGGIEHSNKRVYPLFTDYVAELKDTTSRGNWDKIESMGRCWVNPCIGNKQIAKLTEADLQDIINRAYKKGLSKKTLNNMRWVLQNFLKFCRRRKATNLFLEGLTIPKGAPTKEKHILQPSSLRILFSSDETCLYGKRQKDCYIYAYRFQVLTGLRPGELRGIDRSSIQNDIIDIKRSINKFGEETKGKNENAARRFALFPLASEILEQQLAQNPDSENVFDIPSLSSYAKRWRRYCEANKIPYVTLYQMRHTFISLIKSLPDGMVKALVGHSQSMDTFGVYGHEVTGELQKTAQKVSDIFTEVLKSDL